MRGAASAPTARSAACREWHGLHEGQRLAQRWMEWPQDALRAFPLHFGMLLVLVYVRGAMGAFGEGAPVFDPRFRGHVSAVIPDRHKRESVETDETLAQRWACSLCLARSSCFRPTFLWPRFG
eukprot:563937-Pyramimonas_sp.AAC.1